MKRRVVPAFMMSLLTRQWVFLADAFRERYGGHWLVWEPGHWLPARTEAEANAAHTLRAQGLATRPGDGDALCFELKPSPGARVSVGRSSDNDIAVNDLTLSREQFVLLADATGARWSVLPAHDAQLTLDGRPLVPGAPTPLSSGQALRCGDVGFTWLGPEGLEARVRALAG